MNTAFYRHLFATLLLVIALMLAFGCTQKTDVVQSKDRATITLKPTNLPKLDSIYDYELWMVKINGADSTFTSLGKFDYDDYWGRFINRSGQILSGQFEVPEAWFSYDRIMVSIENYPDPSPAPSGTFMLVDNVIDPATRPIDLKFPADFSLTTGNFFIATPTDNPTDLHDEVKGMWICSRSLSPRDNRDTLGLRVDSVRVASVTNPDSNTPDMVGIIYPPDSIWVPYDTLVVFGYDTLVHYRINVEWVYDTVPDSIYTWFLTYSIDSLGTQSNSIHPGGQDTARLGTILYYSYLGPLEELPDIKPVGWRYNSWIFLEYPPAAANLPKMAKFGYERYSGVDFYTGDTTWSVLPLGGFFRGDSADFSNNYDSNLEVPNFPGSDFVNGAASSRFSNLSFAYPNSGDTSFGGWGSVVIGMEPNPDNLTIDTTRNFPIFVLSSLLPNVYDASFPDSLYNQYYGNVYLFHNYTQFLPRIRVDVAFHE